MNTLSVSGYTFSGPYDPNKGFTNVIAAVYVIVDDQARVIDVGQTDDLNNRFPNHPRQNCWNYYKTGNISLYILKVGSEQVRRGIESKIRAELNPPCGEK